MNDPINKFDIRPFGGVTNPAVPVSDKFEFRPMSLFPTLHKHVLGVNWNSVSKLVELVIEETPTMDAFRWMEVVKARHSEIEKSPFEDIESNGAWLILYGREDIRVATIKLTNMAVLRHEVQFTKAGMEYGILTGQPVRHRITVSYSKHTIETHTKIGPADQDEHDEEWRATVV